MAAEAGANLGGVLGRSRAAVLRRLPTQVVRRLGWGVADQAVSSLTNFAVTLYVAKVLGATQFGAFSLVYVTYSVALNASRGLSTDPLMVRFSGTDLPAWRRAVASCTGTAAAMGLIAGGVVLVAAGFLDGTTRSAFVALGVTLPGLLLQDSWRYSFFALGRGSQAFLNDLIWASALVPGLLFLRVMGHANVFSFVLAWGAAATVAAAAGPLQARVLPRISRARSWLSEHRDLGPRYLAENTSNSGASQLRLYGVGIVAGLAAVGYVQAATTLMGPFLVIYMGISLVTVPEAARVLRRSPHHLRLYCVLVSGGLAVMGLAWGAVLLVALPRGLGDLLLGRIWRPAYPLVLPLTISVVGACASAGATSGLHALGAARRSLRAMILASAAYLGCGLIGAVVGGAAGSVNGIALATWIGAVLWWWQLRAGLREFGRIPAGDQARPGQPGPGRQAGRHRAIRGPALTPSADVTAPLDLRAVAAAASARATARPGSRAQRHQRAGMPVAARVAIIAAVVAVPAAAATGWMLVHGQARAHESPVAQAPATVKEPVRKSVTEPARPKATLRALTPVSDEPFNPYGTGPENSQLAPLAIDTRLATAWTTQWYKTANFGGLKPGTGLLLDMGRAVTVTRVRLLLGSARGADVQVRAGTVATSLNDLPPVSHATGVGGAVVLRLRQPVNARYLLIWFTRLPPDASGTFQASIYNVRPEGPA